MLIFSFILNSDDDSTTDPHKDILVYDFGKWMKSLRTKFLHEEEKSSEIQNYLMAKNGAVDFITQFKDKKSASLE